MKAFMQKGHVVGVDDLHLLSYQYIIVTCHFNSDIASYLIFHVSIEYYY